MNLRNIPIRRKLTFVIMLTSSVVLILTSAAFITYEVVTYRGTLLRHAQSMAQIVAANSTAALSFDDVDAATETLSKLGAERTILLAGLYQLDGDLMARYPAQSEVSLFPSVLGKDGYDFHQGTLSIVYPVIENTKRVGTLYLKTDLAPMFQRFRLYALIVVGVMIGSILVALLFSNLLQKRISGPILELAETARAISDNKDYRVRASKHGEDEIGLFTEAFNHMLTEIDQRDKALRQSEERLRLSLEASQTGTWELNLETNIMHWDDQLHYLHGVAPGTFDGRLETFLKLVHPDDRERVEHQIKSTVKQGTEFTTDYRIIWPDKAIHYLAARGKALPNESGLPSRMSGVALDITESRQAAQALSLLAAIVESSDDAIIGKNLEGQIVSWNQGAERMFGYSAEEAIGQHSDIVVPPEFLRHEQRSLQNIHQGKTEHYETVRVRKDGSRIYVSLTMSPIRNANGKIIGASANSRDITDRIRAEEEIRTLNAELEERVQQRTSELAATNKELEAFTYSVSHDLRAPLRHIDAFAQMLQEEIKSGSLTESQRYLDRIRRGVQNMGQLVDDLLNLSRVGRLELAHEEVDLNDIVNEVVNEMKPELANRQVEWHIGELPKVKCDPGLIKQVFTNLLSNSVKYTRRREEAVIEIGNETVEGQKAVYVRDNGVGFNMKFADKLFGVFQRLHRAEDFEGTGVGLATVHRIIQMHDGRIWAHAELDKGATFHFTLKGM